MPAARRPAALLALLALCATAAALPCPPFGFDSVHNLDLAKYMDGAWHVQLQEPNAYQPENTMFCVRAEYKARDPKDFSKGFDVESYMNKGKINGEVVHPPKSTGGLVMYPQTKGLFGKTETLASKLNIGPRNLEGVYKAGIGKPLFGPFWIVAVGESANATRGYDWSVVSGGAPSVPTLHGKCRTGDLIPSVFEGMKGDGLWIFTRNPIDPVSTTAAVQAAQALGFDVRELRPVVQRGCLYGKPPTAAPPPPQRAQIPQHPAAAAGKAVAEAVGKDLPVQLEAGKAAPSTLPDVTRKIYFDLAQGDTELGRVVLGLYGGAVPGTVENFAMIALGQTPNAVSYKGTEFHRVIENFMVQGGDIVNGDGTGSFTVWDGKGGKFADENLEIASHDRPGVLSMANSGKDTNGCQFFITTVPTPWLDGKHQIFGRVLEGLELVEAVSHIEVDAKDRPVLPVIIKNVGEIKVTGTPAKAPATGTPAKAPATTPATGVKAASNGVKAASTTATKATTTKAATSSGTVKAASTKATTKAASSTATKAGTTKAGSTGVKAASTTTKASTSTIKAASTPANGELPKVTRYIWFDLEQADVDLGRVVLGLYGDAVPGTVENFAMIALGQTPGGVSYKGSKFHRVIENFMLQGGDIVNGDGTGAFTVWDGKNGRFADENLGIAKHDRPGVLSMANSGKDTNGCQFFITTVPTPWLDGKHQIFGRVVEGLELIEAVSHIEVDAKDRPVLPVIIKNVGEIKLNGGKLPVSAASTPAQAPAPAPAPAKAAAPVKAAAVPEEKAAPPAKLESGKIAAASASGAGGDPKITRYIYFDLAQDGVDLGRVLLGLYGDVAPGTVENFAMIALGQTPGGVSYKGSKFHRVIENFMLQGGDIVNGDGTGAFTVWDGKGGKFADENLKAGKHSKPGVLSMANSGPDSNGSQFFITTVPTPWLDGKHQIFGRVVEGMEIVDAISHVKVDGKDRPVLPIIIKDAGEVPLTR